MISYPYQVSDLISQVIRTADTASDWQIAKFGAVNNIIFVVLQNSAKNALAEPGELVVKCKCILITTALKLGLSNFITLKTMGKNVVISLLLICQNIFLRELFIKGGGDT